MKQISKGLKKISLVQWIQVLSLVLTLVVVLSPVLVVAQFQPPDAGGTGLPNDTSFSSFIIKIINIALAIAGLVAVLFLIIGGFRYITSAGNEEVSAQAKKIILDAIIGIVVIILSFVIVRVISNALTNRGV